MEASTDHVSLYSVWCENRAENIGFGLACARGRDGKIPGVVPGPNGVGLEVRVTERQAAKAALRRVG